MKKRIISFKIVDDITVKIYDKAKHIGICSIKQIAPNVDKYISCYYLLDDNNVIPVDGEHSLNGIFEIIKDDLEQ